MWSLYWDDFDRRAEETAQAVKIGGSPPVRRVAVFITDRCNFFCKYCNHRASGATLSQEKFESIVERYGGGAIIHITGGEPSVVPWLYPFLRTYGGQFRFHLNTNAFIPPPAESVKRLKVSLDHFDAAYWDKLVGRSGAFDTVCGNIKRASELTTTTITYTLTKENFKDAPRFARFAAEQFPSLYAVFFSIYKGCNPAFALTAEDADLFFEKVLSELETELGPESLALIRETIDEKRRLVGGVRFPEQSQSGVCYLSMSERVVSPQGEEFTCSHLYRDGVFLSTPMKHDKCLYGCNRRLVKFNEEVFSRIGGKDVSFLDQQFVQADN